MTRKRTEMTEHEFKTIVEKIVGPVEDWSPSIGRGTVEFRTRDALSLKTITALSEALGTDEINFNFGTEREPGYGEYTPSCGGTPGYVELKWPLPRMS